MFKKKPAQFWKRFDRLSGGMSRCDLDFAPGILSEVEINEFPDILQQNIIPLDSCEVSNKENMGFTYGKG